MGSTACSASLPQESIPPLLELLGASELAVLRRTGRLEGFGRQAHVAELTALVLQLLQETSFPFTHAAYVLGLNGPYYSYDTVADDHYGIPKALPALVCQLFRLCVPGVPFTTVRLQKLSAAANFGGKHRTLAFSLSTPPHELVHEVNPPTGQVQPQPSEDDFGGRRQRMDVDQEGPVTQDEDEFTTGHALFLSSSACRGGRGEVCDDINVGAWRSLAKPSREARWAPFPRASWLQWHWPLQGDLFAITVTCEPLCHRSQLSRREHRAMIKMGFSLPEETSAKDESEVERTDDSPAAASSSSGAPATPSQPTVRRSAAALSAARRILGFDSEEYPSVGEVEEAFRHHVRAVHPDRQAVAGVDEGSHDANSRTSGWAVSQLTWARKVLREAAALEGQARSPLPTADNHDFLMLGAPAEAEP